MKKILSLLPCTLIALSTFASATVPTTMVLPTQTSEGIEFPDADNTYLKDIPRYDGQELSHITNGINDDTVRQLIGNPHFSEFMSNEWNYILNIREPNTKNYIQCQLQLHFDKEDIVESHYWNNPQCEAVLNPPKAVAPQPVAAPVPVLAPKVRTFTLASDLLFDFDSAQLKSSSAANIDTITTKIKQEYSKIRAVDVIGHTDYLGDNAYNQRLSLQRANTIRQALIERGFQQDLISIQGMGESQPLTNDCRNMSHSQTKLCLAPDRRVEVQVSGELR